MVTARRSFLQTMTGGLLSCGCNLFGLKAIAASYQSQSEFRRRQLGVNHKKVRTVDMHAHAYVHDVWP